MPTDLSLAELSALAAVPARTIRYYLAQGLLPSPGREGPSTRYPVAVLHRLRLIRQLQRSHLPLAEIRRRLAAMADEEVEALVDASADTPPTDTALDYVQGILAAREPPPGRAVPASQPSAGLLRSMVEPATGAPPLVTPASTWPSAPSPSVAGARLSESASAAPPADVAATSAPVPPTPVPAVPERSQWERIVLEPDVELHVRRPSSRIANRRVDRLVAFARQLLEEDQP